MPQSSSSSYSSTVHAPEEEYMGEEDIVERSDIPSFPDSLLGSDQVLKPFLKAARQIPLSINPFANLTRIIYAGISENVNEEDNEWVLCLYILAVVNLHFEVRGRGAPHAWRSHEPDTNFKDILSVYGKDPGESERTLL